MFIAVFKQIVNLPHCCLILDWSLNLCNVRVRVCVRVCVRAYVCYHTCTCSVYTGVGVHVPLVKFCVCVDVRVSA